jgi:micrococcal nuclease
MKELESFNDKTPSLTLNGITTMAKCTKCYDADTVHLVIPYNNGYYRWTCRLEEIDSAEIKSKDKAEQAHAIKSRDYLQGLILDKIVEVKCGKFDKYGRLLVYISIDGLKINEHLIKEGYAYKYNGGTKINFAEWVRLIL